MCIRLYYFIAVACIATFSTGSSAFASITPVDIDGVVRSSVELNQTINQQSATVITGGVEREENLFYVFKEFNIPTGENAFFLNDTGFSRVFAITVGDVSTIDGILGIIGEGDLFFVNSNGINFGPNAVLALEGSFLGTTASSISFADGTTLLVGNNIGSSLLSSSIPNGLGFSSQTAHISVENRGHELAGSGILPYAEKLRHGSFSTIFRSHFQHKIDPHRRWPSWLSFVGV